METWSTIYSKTYNFVYLRAKSIFGKEEDAQQLMKEVYVKAMEDQVNEDRLYSWLGKTVYTLGCSKFRKKNVREAKHIELEEREYYPSNTVYVEKTIDVLCETIEELPDMYQATLYAFYYDHLPIKDIAQLMGYSYKAIVNRLNYIHKYLSKSLQMRASEMEEDIEFSVEMLCEALEEWSSRNRLSANVAQNIYANICRELGTRPQYECNEEEIAGAKNRMRGQGKDVEAVLDELQSYQQRVNIQIEPKQLLPIGVVAALVILLIVLLFSCGKKDDKKPSGGDNPAGNEEVLGDDNKEEEKEEENEENKEEEKEEEQQPDPSSEYVVPNSDTVLLTRQDLAHLTLDELGLARNEIFARHGMIFGLKHLKEHFGSKSWYKPEVSVDDFYKYKSLSQIEEKNIALILQLEAELRQ